MRLSADNKAKFIAQFQDPNLTVKDLVQIWHQASGTLYRWGFELGVKRPKPKGGITIALEQARQYCEEVSRELPPAALDISVPTFKSPGTKMDLILKLSDWHPGRLTPSFNAEVLERRVYALGVRLVALRRSLNYDIRKLHIFAEGDLTTGEQVGLNITLEELEHMVLTQVYGIAIPQLCRLTERLLGTFDTIEVTAVRGNHGALGKRAPSKASNWDTVVYLGWEAKMGHIPTSRLTFNIATIEWYNFAKVRNLDWLIVHGDQFSAGQGNPYNTIKTKVDKWHSSMPRRFDNMSMGHFHHFSQIGGAHLNATMLTDDEWAREVLGRDGECGQLVIGVTDRGIEHIMPIYLKDIGGE